jgi:hypothetical protein
MTSVFFNPGEYWIEGGERGNNLVYEEFEKCVDDLAKATQDHDNVMDQLSYLKFLKLQSQSNELINDKTSFVQLLPQLSMAYWNLVCVIVGENCNVDSTVTIEDIELYALDDGGWLIYQLCSRVDLFLSNALEPTRSPSILPSSAPIPFPSASPTNWPSSSPSTKATSFTFAFRMKGTVPCYKEVLPVLMEGHIKKILKCGNSGVCADDLNLDSIITTTNEHGKYGNVFHFAVFANCATFNSLFKVFNLTNTLVSFVHT